MVLGNTAVYPLGIEAQQDSMQTGEMPNHDLHQALQALINGLLNPVD